MTIRRLRIDRNTLSGFFAILLWSTTVPFSRSISEQIGPLTAGAAIHLIGGTLFACSLFFKAGAAREWLRLPRIYLFGCGALFITYTIALFLALGLAANRYQALEVGLVNYLWPSFTILFSLFILYNKAGIVLIPGTSFALVGIFLVLTQGSSVSWKSFSINFLTSPTAYALGLMAAVSWALYSNLTRRWAGPNRGGAVPLFILAAGLVLLLLRLLNPEEGSLNIRVAAEVAFMGVTSVAAYALWDIAMRKGDMVLVAACSYLTPFLSTVLGCIYLRVMPGTSLWWGCLLLVAGSFLSWRSIQNKKRA